MSNPIGFDPSPSPPGPPTTPRRQRELRGPSPLNPCAQRTHHGQRAVARTSLAKFHVCAGLCPGDHVWVLQIATGMYFRDVPLHETVHRTVLYTNAWSLSREPVELPIGRLSFETAPKPVNAVAVEVIDRLESVRPDGTDEFIKATGGLELTNDVADVVAFALNVGMVRGLAQLESMVPHELDERPTRMPWGILRRTFDPGVVIGETDAAQLRDFTEHLLALRRREFEAVMRSIRSIVDASLLVSDDPGLSYTLYVASLESLAQVAIPVETTWNWDSYDHQRRRVVDAAIRNAALTEEQESTIRAAVMEIDQFSLRRRFLDFTVAHVGPEFYRAEAVNAVRPIRDTDLVNALEVAYRLRSQHVHVLEALAPELWALSLRFDTVRWKGRPVLSLGGLDRLCRHVVRSYVRAAPTDLDETFDYRQHLPGRVQAQLAPQYWIWKPENLDVVSAPAVFEGFIELLVETAADPTASSLCDMSAVLEKIESTLPGIASAADRRAQAALYVLWHVVTSPELHRAEAEKYIERFDTDLDDPSVAGLVIRLFTTRGVDWNSHDLLDLMQRRKAELRRGKGQPLPARVEAGLHVLVAQYLWDADLVDDAIDMVRRAVQALPGDPVLMELERTTVDGMRPDIDSFDFVVRRLNAVQEGAESEPQCDDEPIE